MLVSRKLVRGRVEEISSAEAANKQTKNFLKQLQVGNRMDMD